MSEEKKKLATGKKFDKNKIRWDLLPIKPIEATIRVLMLGSKKYGDDNWKRVPHCRRRYYAACLRHLTEWWEGEQIDKESGESHLAHAMCCLVFLMWHEANGTEEMVITEETAAPPVARSPVEIPERTPESMIAVIKAVEKFLK